MPDHVDLSALDTLSEAHRTTVKNALKQTLDRELARVGASGGPGTRAAGAQHTRESGPLHGSQHDKSSSNLADHDLLDRVNNMDERQFAQFSQRLAALKQAGGVGGGG